MLGEMQTALISLQKKYVKIGSKARGLPLQKYNAPQQKMLILLLLYIKVTTSNGMKSVQY